MMLMRTYYEKFHYPQRDFMRPIGEISFHFLSRAPQPTQNYNTLIHPCDYYVWALIAASVMAVTLALLIVDISYAKWTNTSMKGVFHQSIYIGVGAIIDESIMDQYIYKTPCAKARKILVGQWILLGFLITISYKSVILANMMSIEYEKGIDSIDDMLDSTKPLMVIRSMQPLFATDPRPQVIELSRKVKYFDFENARFPQWILDG